MGRGEERDWGQAAAGEGPTPDPSRPVPSEVYSVVAGAGDGVAQNRLGIG